MNVLHNDGLFGTGDKIMMRPHFRPIRFAVFSSVDRISLYWFQASRSSSPFLGIIMDFPRRSMRQTTIRGCAHWGQARRYNRMLVHDTLSTVQLHWVQLGWLGAAKQGNRREREDGKGETWAVSRSTYLSTSCAIA